LSDFFDTDLIAFYAKSSLSRIFVTNTAEFAFETRLLCIVTVLIPCRYLVLGVVEFYNIANGIVVGAFYNTA
jgi:hypothetical protein